ncbi:4,5-DOPA dioxygenase extradiol [Ramlibacter rhizophilus]|uniref:4,5-DOPA dioxygenase extradiol n=2 Tax=Ramlibacter rhizophilus TaxID=1781167 RepID=A0A4Z0BL47_9BURK|nr:4,5-DOPA dioxygenase extradiol [Ramlibacter rhizophilus]
MPAAFIGHGSPMNTLESNRFTEAWRAFGAALPRPRAILAISAHWFIPSTAVTAMDRPPVIHDFYGFPPELFAFDYPAPGAPEVAQEIVDLLSPAFVGLDQDSWGLDHGTWSVLAHLRPDADVPVLQLSIHSAQPLDYHIDIGRRLAPLRERGVFILCSGNVVHNLRLIQRRPDLAFDWAERFDAATRAVMTSRPASLASLASHPDLKQSVPTPEHFLPLAYLCGLCDAAGEAATPFAEGATMGSISMTSYVLGASAGSPAGKPAAALPEGVPAQQTNT